MDLIGLYRNTFNVYHYGAKGDGTTDDSAAIQRAITAASVTGGTVFFPHPSSYYKILTGLTVSSIYVRFQGTDQQNRIFYFGTGAAVTVTADYFHASNIAIHGLGGNYGAGATNTFGLDLNGANYVKLENVSVRYHGSHGINVRGSGSSLELVSCDVRHNAGDGLRCAISVTATQTANALVVRGGGFNLNNLNGITWSAAGLSLTGVRFEVNRGAGVVIDSSTTATTITSKAVSILGCYFETNLGGQISILCGAGVGLYGGNISGNYLRWADAAGTSTKTALIVASGAGSIQHLNLGANAYTIVGVQVTAFADLGSRPANSCYVMDLGSASSFTGLGSAVRASTYARVGNATLVAGTVTVANTTVTASTIVLVSRKTIGGTVGNMSYTVNAGVGFTINSSSGTDTSTVSYLLVEG